MQAKKIDGQAVNGKRTILADVIPLETPYAITIFPIYACNFKCNYCIYSLEKGQRGYVSDVISMDFELYKKCIDDMMGFSEKLKVLHFIGYGEPLLHKDIDKMIQYAVKKNVAESIDIVSNGALLTPELSQKLINSGLNTLRISLQGLNDKTYKAVANVEIDFDKFINNIEYFYSHRNKTRLHIKIIDTGLSDIEKKKFFKTFENICDTIAIEQLVPVANSIDYEKFHEHNNFEKNVTGIEIAESKICPQPFYFMQIYPDGKCIPCCAIERPVVVGDINEESIAEIWNNKKSHEFRKLQINKRNENNAICAKCQHYKFTMFPEEILDDKATELSRLFE